jgi:hypothetical protein
VQYTAANGFDREGSVTDGKESLTNWAPDHWLTDRRPRGEGLEQPQPIANRPNAHDTGDQIISGKLYAKPQVSVCSCLPCTHVQPPAAISVPCLKAAKPTLRTLSCFHTAGTVRFSHFLICVVISSPTVSAFQLRYLPIRYILNLTSSLSERTYQPLAWTLRRPAYQYIRTQYPRWNSASNRLRGGFVTDRPQRNVAGRVSYLLADYQRRT